MSLHYRKTQRADIDRLFVVRASTRDNPISVDRLAQMGITPASMRQGFECEQLCGWVCLADDMMVGFCNGDRDTGEVLVLALLPEYEGRGIGRELLSRVVIELRQQGRDVWLAADSNSDVRAHGFYRKLGWVPSGEHQANGDEILVLGAV